MDGDAMVRYAEQWTNVPSQHICKSQEISEDRYIGFLISFCIEQCCMMLFD